MDGHDVLDAFRHLANSLHLDTPVGMMIAGAAAGVVGLSVHLASKRWKAFARAAAETPTLAKDRDATDEDTLLVMPDISGYGQFLSSVSSAEAARADETVVTMLNAMIQSVGGQLQVAKLEGDAVLFYAPANKLASEDLGCIVLGLFKAFDRRKRDLEIELDLPGLARLELKVAVHRGPARRLAYRNAIDVVGANVVLVYRLLKVDLEARRYVVATDRASHQIAWPTPLKTDHFNQVVGEFGNTPLCITAVPSFSELRKVRPPTEMKKFRKPEDPNRIGLGAPRAKRGKVVA